MYVCMFVSVHIYIYITTPKSKKHVMFIVQRACAGAPNSPSSWAGLCDPNYVYVYIYIYRYVCIYIYIYIYI